MISETVALARLAHERQYWRRQNLKTNHVLGIIEGLNIASHALENLWKETKAQFKRNPRYLSACLSNLGKNHGH